MNLVDQFNTLISKINSIGCMIKNIQVYVGIKGSTDPETLTGKISELEDTINSIIDPNTGKVKCSSLESNCNNEWPDVVVEWD